MMLEILFWSLTALSVYSYFMYPALLAAILRFQGNRVEPILDVAPVTVTFIITAFNEQERIRSKLDNTLAIDCPGLEVIVASDSSTDGTDGIAREYESRGVRLVRAATRLGKENAQSIALQEAGGDVVVFSDAATEIPRDAVRKLLMYFRCPQVGAVSSEDRFINSDGHLSGEGAYVRYEMWLRRMESQLAGLVGLSGSFFAARKSVCEQWDIHSPSDFNTALNCARRGLRAITAPDVLGFYKDLKSSGQEYQRKVRTVLRGLTAVARHPDVLNFRQYGLFAWQVWSHKVLRWAVPWTLGLLLLCNIALYYTRSLYALTFWVQVAFYSVAMLAHTSERFKSRGGVRLVYFFVQANMATLDACWRFIRGRRMTTWQPSTR
jgi:cellulose synthase/poly-beta-1,6-N-acetylglucosamine synthase-like glycosyltransferase